MEQPKVPSNESSQTLVEPTPNLSQTAEVKWWNREDVLWDGPLWFRYPASLLISASAYWAAFVWTHKSGVVLSIMLAFIAIVMARELLSGILFAAVVCVLLVSIGAAVAALPVSLAIIIGAIVISLGRRR